MTTALDLPGILAEHDAFHKRLFDGEFEGAPDGTFDDALSDGQLRPLIQVIGIQGVGSLLHIAHELVIQVLKEADDPYTDVDTDDLNYVRENFNRVLEWGMLASLLGVLSPTGSEPEGEGLSF